MINVSGDLCEQINVITPCDTSKGSRVADLQFVVSPVLEHYGIHRIIFEGNGRWGIASGDINLQSSPSRLTRFGLG